MFASLLELYVHEKLTAHVWKRKKRNEGKKERRKDEEKINNKKDYFKDSLHKAHTTNDMYLMTMGYF